MLRESDLLKRSIEIDNQINKHLPYKANELLPIIDGVVCNEDYCNAKFKIIWLLKEPYDETRGWDYRKSLREDLVEYIRIRTIKRIAYCSFGILNNFVRYDDMFDIGTSGEGLNILKSILQIAIVNIKKLPGTTRSNPWEIEEAYIRDSKIILSQINSYKPDVIIAGGVYSCGSTLRLLLKDLHISEQSLMPSFKDSSIDFYKTDSRLFVSAYHPSTWHISEEKYCDDIINCVKQFRSVV